MRRRSGMTLIELMIGLVIMGAAVAAGYATFASITDQRQRMKNVVDNVSRGANIRRKLGSWLEAGFIQVVSGGAPRNGLQIGSQSARDELRFVTRARTPLGTSFTTVALYVNTSDSRIQPGLVAEFTQLLRSEPQEPTTISIDSTVSSIRVEYLVRQNGIQTWYDSEALAQLGTQPVAVRIYFIARDPSLLTPLLRIPLTVILPSIG